MELRHGDTLIASANVTGDTLPIGSIVEFDGTTVPDGWQSVVTSKIITSTRDAATASGNVSYTGVGFKPNSIRCLMNVDGTLYQSDGVSDNAGTSMCIYQANANVNYDAALLVEYSNYGSFAQAGVIQSYDSDGFTINWTKIGTPTAGTMKLKFICYR